VPESDNAEARDQLLSYLATMSSTLQAPANLPLGLSKIKADLIKKFLN